ncbi:MAG: radical SAM protein, partial [Anaerolineae bacterium]
MNQTPHPPFDFANILFGGPCNMRCPFCIGRRLDPALTPDNLRQYPPRNFDAFLALVRRHGITEITLTGTCTDPQLYRHEARLIRRLRRALPHAKLSLHTNGLLALKKMALFNRYDRVTVSCSSFDPAVHQKITGVPKMANLPEILRRATVPVKVSAIINEHTAGQVDEFLARCAAIGARRVALRRLYGDARRWDILPHLRPARYFRRNPVFNVFGMEVTVWNFQQTSTRALNLFSDGTISGEYLLASAAAPTRPIPYRAGGR